MPPPVHLLSQVVIPVNLCIDVEPFDIGQVAEIASRLVSSPPTLPYQDWYPMYSYFLVILFLSYCAVLLLMFVYLIRIILDM